MKIIYIDCTDRTKTHDYRRRVTDKYFFEDANKEDSWLIDKDLKPYNIEDCMLVRTTNFFPFNHEIHTQKEENAYKLDNSMYFKYPLLEILQEKYPDTWKDEEKKYGVFSKLQRETIHFTINGLVQSHDYGNFEGRKFIILEPLKYHIDDSLLALRPEDTYFKGSMKLSNESSILINDKVYEQIKDDPKYKEELETYANIFVYTGENEELAVREALNTLGYDSFLVSNNYLTNGQDEDYPAKEMTDFLKTFAEVHSISQTPHSYTAEYKEEPEATLASAEEIDGMHLKYILDNSDLPNELKEAILDEMDNYFSNSFKNLLKEAIETIGLEKLEKLTQEFNGLMIEENKKRKQEGMKI